MVSGPKIWPTRALISSKLPLILASVGFSNFINSLNIKHPPWLDDLTFILVYFLQIYDNNSNNFLKFLMGISKKKQLFSEQYFPGNSCFCLSLRFSNPTLFNVNG